MTLAVRDLRKCEEELIAARAKIEELEQNAEGFVPAKELYEARAEVRFRTLFDFHFIERVERVIELLVRLEMPKSSR